MRRFALGALLSLVACQGKLVESTRAPEAPATADGGSNATCAVATTSAYHLIAHRNIAAPLPDPTGIAPDGRLLWVIAGGQNASHDALVRFDPDSGVMDRSFGFDGLIETLGTGVYGITSDGSSI